MPDQSQPNQPEEDGGESAPQQPAKKGFDTKFFLIVFVVLSIIAAIALTPLIGLGLFWLNKTGLQSRYSGNLGFGPGYMFDTDVATGDELDSYLASKGLNELVAKGYGQSAVKAGKAIGINPIFILSLARHEGGDRISRLVQDKNNPFGYGAVDSSAYKSAKSFPNLASAFQFVVGKVQGNYLQPSGPYYASPEKLTEWGNSCATNSDPAGRTSLTIRNQSCTTKADLVVKTAGGDGIADFQKETVESINIKYATHIYWANAIKSKMEDTYEFLGIEAFRDNPNTSVGETGGWNWPLSKPFVTHAARPGHNCFHGAAYNQCADYGRNDGGTAHSPVYAMGDGTIQFEKYGEKSDPYLYVLARGWLGGYNAWFRSSDGKVEAFYAHIYKAGIALNKDLSQPIQVRGGDQFAEVYDPPIMSPHLHFQFKYNGNWVLSIEQPRIIKQLIDSNPAGDNGSTGSGIFDGTGFKYQVKQKPLTNYPEMSNIYDKPTYIVLHYTAGNGGVNSTWNYFQSINNNGNSNDNKYVQFDVAKDGTIYQFLPETRKVAGACGFNSIPSQFGTGISISIENEGYFTAAKPATQQEVEANIELVSYLMKKYNIPKSNVISHQEARRRVGQADPNTQCPGKSDPGNAFMNAVLSKLP